MLYGVAVCKRAAPRCPVLNSRAALFGQRHYFFAAAADFSAAAFSAADFSAAALSSAVALSIGMISMPLICGFSTFGVKTIFSLPSVTSTPTVST